MSKRKEFNSEAKRVGKEQVSICLFRLKLLNKPKLKKRKRWEWPEEKDLIRPKLVKTGKLRHRTSDQLSRQWRKTRNSKEKRRVKQMLTTWKKRKYRWWCVNTVRKSSAKCSLRSICKTVQRRRRSSETDHIKSVLQRNEWWIIFIDKSKISLKKLKSNSRWKIIIFVLRKFVLLHLAAILFNGHLEYFKHVSSVDHVLGSHVTHDIVNL